jgi:hypothetical protein
MYINPGETFGKRYLVFRPVDISWSSTSGDSPAGEMLVHWYSAAEHEHWATWLPGTESPRRGLLSPGMGSPFAPELGADLPLRDRQNSAITPH